MRDVAKGETVAASIAGDTEVRRLDLADLASIHTFADAWQGDVDVLINNAGVMATPEKVERPSSSDWYKSPWPLRAHQPAAATYHRSRGDCCLGRASCRLDFVDDLNWQSRRYQRWPAYQQSKLANLLFTLELQRLLTKTDSPVRALAAHPGYAATNLQSRTESRWQNRLMALSNRLFAQTDEAGARPTLFAASQDLPGASYVGPDRFGEHRGHPTLVGRTAAASDVEMAAPLTLSGRATGVEFPLARPIRVASGLDSRRAAGRGAPDCSARAMVGSRVAFPMSGVGDTKNGSGTVHRRIRPLFHSFGVQRTIRRRIRRLRTCIAPNHSPRPRLRGQSARLAS